VEEAGKDAVPAAAALAFLAERPLSAEEAAAVADGRAVPAEEHCGDGPVRLTFQGRLVAVARSEGAELRPEVVLA
jgi:Pseudouridine synthase II TruB, C-terminal